ncbi:GNAT family N-acetyltransferase [Cohnella sp. GCM10027633]|uniref:GNAT family N-acetyltransferase n=1 Tax=unclassified Cohnella TaxID=2636738 RepID=UPI0036300302
MDVKPIVLEGSRVVLTPMEEAHIEGLYHAGSDARIWELQGKLIEHPDDMRKFVLSALSEQARGTELPFTIIDQETGKIVGSTRFMDIMATHRALEIGWTWYHPDVWRTRVNTECKYLLLRHAFETLGTVRVQLKTDKRNTRSQAAIQRIGGVYEGTLRNHRILPDGYIRDTVYFSIVASEWPDAKKRLEGYLS